VAIRMMRKSPIVSFVLKVYVFFSPGTKLNNALEFLHDIIGTVSRDFFMIQLSRTHDYLDGAI
jgi:hypothetical protein